MCRKLLKFYFQSFLFGVPVSHKRYHYPGMHDDLSQEIIVGFRKPNGRLLCVQSFQTAQIPRLVRGKPSGWNPNVCLEWGDRFLAMLERTVQPSGVWRVTFTPRVGVAIAMLDESGVKEVENGEDRVGFLPRWYWDERSTPE